MLFRRTHLAYPDALSPLLSPTARAIEPIISLGS